MFLSVTQGLTCARVAWNPRGPGGGPPAGTPPRGPWKRLGRGGGLGAILAANPKSHGICRNLKSNESNGLTFHSRIVTIIHNQGDLSDSKSDTFETASASKLAAQLLLTAYQFTCTEPIRLPD